MAVRFSLQNISKTYQHRHSGRVLIAVKALNNVNLDINERQVNALVGKSGAGKSTLARIVLGFEKADCGQVIYQNQLLSTASRAVFCRQNQMMFQNPYLAVNPCFTARHIIGEPLRIAAVKPALIAEKLRQVLELLELPAAYLERLPHELSGGELQRVILARALVLEPEFLVLDEPFSALDDLTAIRIIMQFKKIFSRLQIGVLLVAHDRRHVRLLADRVAVLERGQLLGQES